jgi:hypothetical protein
MKAPAIYSDDESGQLLIPLIHLRLSFRFTRFKIIYNSNASIWEINAISLRIVKLLSITTAAPFDTHIDSHATRPHNTFSPVTPLELAITAAADILLRFRPPNLRHNFYRLRFLASLVPPVYHQLHHAYHFRSHWLYFDVERRKIATGSLNISRWI